MICLRCLAQRSSPATAHQQALRLARRSVRIRQDTRPFSQTSTHYDATQPFTTPVAASISARTISTSSASLAESTTKKVAAGASGSIAVRSSTPAGTILKGLNFHKDKSDPIAMEDVEYPDWLWNVLDEVRSSGGSKEPKGLSTKASKKKDKKGLTIAREVIPVHRQTIDLPTGDGTNEGLIAAINASSEITKAMRAERRAKIKENNFLRTMN